MSEIPLRPAPHHSLLDRLRGWVEWVGIGRLVASAVVVLAVVAGAYWLVQPPPATTESKLPYAGASGSAGSSPAGTGAASTLPAVLAGSTTTSVAASLVVHVAGAVAAPGVYRVPSGARVIDAVLLAGGMATDADADAINLAAPVADGERVYVPHVGEAVPAVVNPGTGGGTGASGSTTPAGPVNLNTATADLLDTLPGVGPATAAAILAYRDEHGPFASVEALGEVRGIGPAKLDALRGLVTV